MSLWAWVIECACGGGWGGEASVGLGEECMGRGRGGEFGCEKGVCGIHYTIGSTSRDRLSTPQLT